MTKGYLLRTIFSLSMLCTVVVAQENVDAIEKARQAKEAADKAAAEAAAATSAAIEAAAEKAAKEARSEAKRKKEEEEARKIAEAQAAEEAELDAAASAASEEARRKMAAELGLEVEDSSEEAVTDETVGEEEVVEEVVEDVVAKENLGWGLGLTGSVGMINGEYILNTPVGASLIITTPYGLKLGPLDLEVSLAFGSYSGETPSSPEYSPTVLGIGGNLTLFKFLFYEGHVGLVGAGLGGRGFGGVTLEKLMKRNLNLPFNLLIGAEGFLSTKLEDSGEEASYWGGLGLRLDYSF